MLISNLRGFSDADTLHVSGSVVIQRCINNVMITNSIETKEGEKKTISIVLEASEAIILAATIKQLGTQIVRNM